jgi:AAA domain
MSREGGQEVITARNLELTPAYEQLLLLLIGKEGSGKSCLAATGRKNVLFLDYDGRAQALAGRHGVYSITFKDAPWPAQPTAMSETLDILTKLEASRDLSTFGLFDVPKETMIKTIVPDSITTLAKTAMSFGLYGQPSLRREVNFGTGSTKIQVQVPKSFDGWNAEMGAVENIIIRLLSIPDIDVICTMHETAEEAPDSTDETPKYTGKVSPFPARHGRLIKYFNECWRLTREQQVPKIQFIPDFYFTTKSGLDLSGITIKPDIEYLIAEHTKKQKEKK